MTNEPMVQLKGVSKRFGRVVALRHVDLSLARGRCLGLFGPNGAGKTTLLKILATLLRPSSGTVRIAGYDAVRDAHKVRPLLGVVGHRTFLYGQLTASENLWFYGRMLGVTSLAERIAEVLALVDLAPHAHRLVRTFSRGMQQRLAIARAILHRPPLLLLDEPFAGVDQGAKTHLYELLRQLLTNACTVVLSTHDLQSGLGLCDEIAIQCRGAIVYRGPAAGLDAHTLEQLYLDHVG